MASDIKLDPVSDRNGSETRLTNSGRGTKMFSRLFGSRRMPKKDASESGGLDGEGGEEHTDNVEPLPRKVKTMRKKAGKSKGSVLAELRAEEERRELELQEGLTVSERGYLPVHVRSKLLDLNNIPQTPLTESSKGVVMFADISGFTNLGKELRAQMPALEAASKLAIRIGTVLKELTNICHEFEGDVVKFAGDALLCVWENHDEQWMLERAKACAVSMLNKIKNVDNQLDLHGGIAMGNLLHVHLGDRRQELLWYLLTGDAVVRAANLVDEAPRGHILYQPRKNHIAEVAKQRTPSEISDSGGTSSQPFQAPVLERLPSVLDHETLTATTKTMLIPTHQRQKSLRGATDDDMPMGSPGDTRRASLEYLDGQDEALAGRGGTRMRTSTEDDPFLNMKITPRGRAYIPRALKNILMSGRIESGEMRNRVAILFAALPGLVLQEAEIVSNKLSEERVRLLNDTFAHISTILRQSDGEFRDLLFDDKGCIFIAVFGAYGAIEMPELKALKAAKRMNAELEVEDLKIGVSVGTCFVGLVGNDVRHDMVVMGHEVNMAARYMAKSQEGSILVSSKIHQATRDFFGFQEVQIHLNKKNAPGEMEHHPSARRFQSNENDLTGDSEAIIMVIGSPSNNGSGTTRRDSGNSVSDPNGAVVAYRPTKEITRRASFTALYRYSQVIPDQFFVGRRAELQKLQGHMIKASTTKQSSLCIVSGPKGYGKSWLIREFRHRNDDKFSSALGVAFELNVTTPLFVFRQILETLFELFDGMPKSKAKLVITQWTQANIKVDYVLLEKLFPYIMKLIPQARRASSAPTSGLGVSARFGKLIGSIRLTSTPLTEEAEGAGEPSGGEGSPTPNAVPGMKKQQSLERLVSAGSGSPPNMEEIRHSTGSAGTSALATQSPQRLRAGSQAAGGSNRFSSMGGSRRMISGRSMLGVGAGGDSIARKTTAGSSRSLLGGGGDAVNSGAGSQQASSAQSTQLAKTDEAAALKRRLARKQSRPEMNLVMGQKELDPLVKFIMSLLEFAASEAIKVGKKGLVIIVEDIQWLDALSLQVLNELIDRMMNSKGMQNIFILASCRNADPDKPEEEYYSSNASDMRPLLEQRLLERAKEVKLFNLVEVDVLSRDEVDSLVSKVLVRGTGDSVSSEILDAVYKNSGGMPNAIADVIELIRQDGGAIFLDPNTNQWKWRTAKGTLTAGGQSVLHVARQAFVSRIDNLSIATRDLLKIAACVSDDKSKFRLQDIVDVLSLDLEHKSRYTKAASHVPTVEYISNKLQEAVSAGLLKFRKQFLMTSEDWGFASSAIAETVLEMVPTDRLNEIKGMKKNLESAKTGAAAEGLFDFLGGV